MSLFLSPAFPAAHSSVTLSSSFKPHKNPSKLTKSLPPTDKIIDFGKYRGKMLGTLPSTYLKWVSKNLRARDMEEWAKLADQVLQHPRYKDRIEWEFAQSVLTGNNLRRSLYNGDKDSSNSNAVSRLLELSEIFGWDNEDKAAWSRVNFELLGTSKGGQLPRRLGSAKERSGLLEEEEKKLPERSILTEIEERRRERRLRAKKIINRDYKGEINKKMDCIGNNNENEDVHVNQIKMNNPFPGRQALLKKVFNRRKVLL